MTHIDWQFFGIFIGLPFIFFLTLYLLGIPARRRRSIAEAKFTAAALNALDKVKLMDDVKKIDEPCLWTPEQVSAAFNCSPSEAEVLAAVKGAVANPNIAQHLSSGDMLVAVDPANKDPDSVTVYHIQPQLTNLNFGPLLENIPLLEGDKAIAGNPAVDIDNYFQARATAELEKLDRKILSESAIHKSLLPSSPLNWNQSFDEAMRHERDEVSIMQLTNQDRQEVRNAIRELASAFGMSADEARRGMLNFSRTMDAASGSYKNFLERCIALQDSIAKTKEAESHLPESCRRDFGPTMFVYLWEAGVNEQGGLSEFESVIMTEGDDAGPPLSVSRPKIRCIDIYCLDKNTWCKGACRANGPQTFDEACYCDGCTLHHHVRKLLGNFPGRYRLNYKDTWIGVDEAIQMIPH